MAIQMCDLDNFDIGQISPKLAQRQYFVYNFYYKKVSIVGSLNNAENCLKTLFLRTPVTKFSSNFSIIILKNVKRLNLH